MVDIKRHVKQKLNNVFSISTSSQQIKSWIMCFVSDGGSPIRKSYQISMSAITDSYDTHSGQIHYSFIDTWVVYWHEPNHKRSRNLHYRL